MEITKRDRKNPIRTYFAGMELLIGTYKSNHRIDISYKAAGMKQAFTREYTPIVNDPNLPPPAIQAKQKMNTNESSDASIGTETTSITLQVGEYPPEQVIQWTLQEKLSKYFLPALFKDHPAARNGSIHLSAIGPYVLQKLHDESSPLKQSTKDTEKKSLQRMIQLWGDIPLVELTPKYCEYDLVHKMSVTPAEECIRLMRKLYPNVVLGTITDAFVWTNYCHPERKKKYIPKRRVRSVLLNVSPAPGIIAQAITRCRENICLGREASKFLAALIMIINGISIDEVCALRAKHLLSLDSNEKGLLIEDIVVNQRKEDNDTQHTRRSRHTIEAMEPPEHRILGVSSILAKCWDIYAGQHPDFKGEQLLLTSNENRKRILAPADFKLFLITNFSDIIPENCLVIEDEKIRTSFDIEDTCIAVARYLLTDLASYSSEELRYHFAQKPAEMDGRHYAGFDAPSAIITMGKMQTKALTALLGSGDDLSTSSKVYPVEGRAGCVSKIHIEIDIAEMLSRNDMGQNLMMRFSALGFSQKISFIENKN